MLDSITNGNGAVLPTLDVHARCGRAVPATLAGICTALTELQVRRKFCISLANKQTNATGALVRRYAGFATEDSEEDREKIKKRAARIVAAVLAGKEQKPEDVEIAEEVHTDLMMVAKMLEPLQVRRAEIELKMKQLVRTLPISAWAKSVRGLGELGVAVIIAETGDLSNYATKRKVWRRLGLGMAPSHEAHAYSTWKFDWRNNGGLTTEDWKIAGYAPKRRAEIHACVAEPMAKHQLLSAEKSGTKYGLPQGPYGEAYVKRRTATALSHPDWTPKHSQMDGLRIMTKKLLADLWSEWRMPDIVEVGGL